MGAFWVGHWTAGVLARRWSARGAPDRLRRPGKWRAVQFGAHIAVIPAKAGISDRPQGQGVCLSWMQGALVAFVGMTLRKHGPRASSPAGAGAHLAVMAGLDQATQTSSCGVGSPDQVRG